MNDKTHPIIFFDGVCTICNRTVDFIIKRDPKLFMFAPLQGKTAKLNLSPHLTEVPFKSIVLLDESGVYVQSQAILRILSRLGWPWNLTRIFNYIPNKVINLFYDYFSSHRYRWFGKKETCRRPTPQERTRFLD